MCEWFCRQPIALIGHDGLELGGSRSDPVSLPHIIVGSFVAFDYILLPRFRKEIGAGLGISFPTDIEIGNYQSILGAFLNKALSPKSLQLLNSIYSMVTLIVLPFLAGGIIN